MYAADLAAGLTAGAAQDALLHPLDTLRARLNAAPHHTSANASPLTALAAEALALMRADGLRGLYRGYAVALLGCGPANALYFSTYHASRRRLHGADAHEGSASAARDALAGLSAEVVANCVYTPVDVVKQRMQVARGELHFTQALCETCAYGGVSSLWRGYGAGVALWGPFSAAYFAMYESLKGVVGRRVAAEGRGQRRSEHTIAMISGFVAGGAAAVLTQPLDCAKTRIQVGLAPTSAGFIEVVLFVWRREGFSALMRGSAARALYLASGCSLAITVFEAASKALGGSATT